MLSVANTLWKDVRTCDAAADFFFSVLVQGEDLQGKAEVSGGRSAGKRRAGPGLQLLKGDPWEALFSMPATSGIMTLLNHLKTLDAVMEHASSAWQPSRFHRHGFAHPALNRAEDVQRFKDDPEGNPFWQFAHHAWEPFAACSPPDLALLWADTPGKAAPAATLASAWQARWPRIPLYALGKAIDLGKPPSVLDTGTCDQWPSEVQAGLADLEAALADDGSSQPKVRSKGPSPDGLETPVSRPLIPEEMAATVQGALKSGEKMVVWRPCGASTGAVTDQLYQASRQGLWNHLIFTARDPDELKRFAAANANIIHSYCHQQEPLSAFSDPVFSYPLASPAYGRTQPMPGKPLWMSLKDATLMRLLLFRFDLKAMMRMRVKEDGREVFEVGRNLKYHFKRPGELPPGSLEEIVRMVDAGGSVNLRFVRQNLEKAYLIAYVEEHGVIVGNSSLKHPRDEYIDAVSRQSGIDLHDFLERGYTSVRPEYRGLGIGAKLLEGLTRRAGDHKIFSVIAENNVATQKMAIRNRTRRVATFFSERAGKQMGVWIPEWMLPEGIDLPDQPDVR